MEVGPCFDEHPIEVVSVVGGDHQRLYFEYMFEELDEQSILVRFVEYGELAWREDQLKVIDSKKRISNRIEREINKIERSVKCLPKRPLILIVNDKQSPGIQR